MTEHAVENGVLQHASVSQVTTFDEEQPGGCERKWYYDKVERRPRKETKSQARGKQLHAEIEEHLKTGAMTLSPLALAGKRFMPTPRTGPPFDLLVEHSLSGSGGAILDAQGVPFEGQIDVVNLRETYLTDEGEAVFEVGVLEVIDWKSTSDMKWAKTGTQLRKTIQMPGYAEWARRQYKLDDRDRVRLSHGYFVTTGRPYSEKRTTSIEVRDVRTAWQRVEELVGRMKVAASAARPDDIKPNLDACAAFRGCPHQSYCPAASDATWGRLFSTATKAPVIGAEDASMDLLSKFTAPARPEPSPEVRAEIKKIEAEETSLRTPTPAPVTEFRGVNPPDAAKSEPPKSAEPIPADALSVMPPSIQEAAKAFLSIPADVVERQAKLDEASVSADRSAPVDAPKKRTLRKSTPTVPVSQDPHGSMPLAAVEVHVTPAPVPAAQMISAPVATMTAPQVASKPWFSSSCGITVLADVVYEGFGGVADLEPYVRGMLSKMEKAYKVPDVRAADGQHDLSFGKWKGLLAAGTRAEPPAAGIYRLADVRESEPRQVVLEALRGMGAAVVRGR